MTDSAQEGDAHTRFLMVVHAKHPGLTEFSIGAARTADGLSSYEAFCRFVNPRQGMAVVDLACGNGPLCELLVKRVGADGQVVGVDLSEAELGLAADRLRGISNVRLIRGSAAQLPLPDASADCVVCHMAFMLFTPFDESVREIGRVLKKGAVFAAVIPTLRAPDEIFRTCAGVLRDALREERHSLEALSGNAVSLNSVPDLARVFQGGGWRPEGIEACDIDVCLSAAPDELVALVAPAFYHYQLLSDAGRRRVNEKWRLLFKRVSDDKGVSRFYFPLSAFSVKRDF